MNPSLPKQLTKTINDWGSVLEAAQRLILQLLGMAALIYLVVQANLTVSAIGQFGDPAARLWREGW